MTQTQKATVPFTLHADRQLIRAAGRSRRFLCAGIQAPEAPTRPGRLLVNLAFVLDRSGSMDGQKIAHAREAVLHGLRSLHAEDRFAVVAFDDQVSLVVPTTFVTAGAREQALAAVSRITARGQTDLHGGWHNGCEQVAAHLAADAVGRCLLLTDGLANQGETNPDEIVRRCAAWRERRVTTSAFGVGADFDETLLRRMAEAGGGNFEFVETAAQIADFVASEVGEALAITAREAVLVVEAGEGVTVASLNDFPCRRDGSVWRVELGSLFGGQELHPVLRLEFPGGETGRKRDVTVRIEDEDGAFGGATMTAAFTWASHEDNDRQPRDRVVDRRVAALYAARAERDALEKNRADQLGAARAILERCAEHIGRYAGDDAEIQSILQDLRDKAVRFAKHLDAISRKTLHSGSISRLKQRHIEKMQRRLRPAAKVSALASFEVEDVVAPVLPHLAAADADLFGDLWLDVTYHRANESGPLDPAAEIQLLDEALAQAAPAETCVFFTPRPLSDNWFSHWHGSRGAAIVSLAGWRSGPAVPAEAFVAYELILHGLRVLGPCWAPDQWMHRDTRGCLFDFCEVREDMEIKLQAADLCPSCRATLERAGVPLDRLQRLLEALRTLAVPATVVH
jgi:Ca-activated chloride channel family protein